MDKVYNYLIDKYKNFEFININEFKIFIEENNIFKWLGIDNFIVSKLNHFSLSHKKYLRIDNWENTLNIRFPENKNILKLFDSYIKSYIDIESEENFENKKILIKGFKALWINIYDLSWPLSLYNINIQEKLYLLKTPLPRNKN